MALKFNEKTGMFEDIAESAYNHSLNSHSRQPNDGKWKWVCGVIVLVFAVIFFCINTCASESSKCELVEEADSVEYVEVIEDKQSQLSSVDPIAPSVDYSNITKKVKEWNSVRIISVTETGEAVAVYGNNGYTCQNISDGLVDLLKRINSNKWRIQDININTKESFVVIYGSNGYWAVGVPNKFSTKLQEYHDASENIYSASFNRNGDWCVVTDKHYSCSNSSITEFCKKAIEEYGTLNYVFISDNGIVACCNKGTYWRNIPNEVSKAIKEFKYSVKTVKFTDLGRYCVASDNGGSSFRL